MIEAPLGIYEKAMPAGSWAQTCRRAAELEFSFVELSVDESEERRARLWWGREEREELVRAARNEGVRVPSICLSGNRKAPIGSSDPATVAEGLDILRRGIELADGIGARIVQVAGYDVYYGEESTPATRARFVENLARAVGWAADQGVMLAVEIMDTRFMSSISRFLHVKQQIPSPWLSVYPDLGNLSAWNDNAVEELELGLRLGIVAAIHIKDTYAVTATSPGQFRDVPFGAGCVDFPSLFAVLARHNYRGSLLIEMWNRGEPGVEAVASARDWVRDRLVAV